jgi:outer membrane receptor protein involved in Fe transport
MPWLHVRGNRIEPQAAQGSDKGGRGMTRNNRRILLLAVLAASVSAPALVWAADDEVVVTGSHLRQNGLQSPVPMTTVTAVDLEKIAPRTLIEGVVQLPEFYNSQTPNAGNWFTRGGYGNLDIRGLGINRTLTLLNGRRVISQTAFGGVDINMFPQEMVQRVETVTGGASAAYGTDAVAGVVNFILDTRFTGLRATAEGGETTRGDAGNYTGAAAFGMKLGEKGHLLVASEYFKQDGVFTYKGRDWYQAWGTVPSASNSQILNVYPHVVSKDATFGGVISSPNPLLNGLAFNPDGSTYVFQSSSVTTGNIGTSAGHQSIANGGSGDDLGGATPTLYPDLKRYSNFVYADYDVAKGLNVFVQYLRGNEDTFAHNAPTGAIEGTPTAVTIFSGNAFLPANVQQIMTANKIASFVLRRIGGPLDFGGDITIRDTSLMNSLTPGFKWNIDNGGGPFNGWEVDGYYQYGHNTRRDYQVGLNLQHLFAAVDAVKNPATGQIVCRTTLFSSTFSSCQPLDLFGAGAPSSSAISYVVGETPGVPISTPLYFAGLGYGPGLTDSYTSQVAKVTTTEMTQHVAELSANGEIFKGWGAGPVTAAIGGSFRRESILQVVRDPTNPPDDNDHGHPVLCNADAAAIAACLRGENPPDCANTVGIQYSKVSNIIGSLETKEAFVELGVPVLADLPFARLIKTDIAARWADYTGSGGIWAYKAGADWEVVDGLRFRGTYSRDVRAANLSERFDKTGGAGTITDPAHPSAGVINITTFSGGNPNVKPERADTWTAGAVLQPSWLPGLQMSGDWYMIKIKDAIGQLGAQNVVNQCFNGAANLCSLITRDATTGLPILVGNVYVNINQAVVRGVDFEIDYHRDVHLIGGPEQIVGRFLGSWLMENSQNIGTYTNRAGQVGVQQSDGVGYALPTFKASLSLTYSNGPFSGFVQERFISAGADENSLPTPTSPYLADNHVPAVFYTDLQLSYALPERFHMQIFGTITNLFDKAPPITPYYSTFAGYSTQYNPSLYDTLGRRFTLGAKIRF